MSIRFATGNVLEADAEALVNTVNTVGVMGKGIALMFKEAFPENFDQYESACKEKRVQVGKVFVTERFDLLPPRWIVNFPTKKHWRQPSKLEWIEDGLSDLVQFMLMNNVKSIAIPPLGSGNGGLDWRIVREKIVDALSELNNVDVLVYEPTRQYQNVVKRDGVKKLTPERALIAELVRRYAVLGIECTLVEVQKLAYFLERIVDQDDSPAFSFDFVVGKFGPYSDNLRHLLNSIDGSYLHCEKRLADAAPLDTIRFEFSKSDTVAAYLMTPEMNAYRPALEATSDLVDGFQSPFGLELLATVDWQISRQGVKPSVGAVRESLVNWAGGQAAGRRKQRLFDERVVGLALEALQEASLV
ncbi:MAG: macro domain-containing protein [Rhodospirillales bacterium]|nr:macro domain-containing protein [Rhodospirillales bacterium]